MRTFLTTTTGLVMAMAATACAPSVERVAVPTVAATRWNAKPPLTPVLSTMSDDDFWRAMRSPLLADMIARGLAGNATLDIAVARIDQARAGARIAGAALLPSLAFDGGISGRRLRNYNTAQYDTAGVTAGLDLAWELDLFGGQRAGRRAAIERYRAARLDASAAALLIQTEIARTFVQIAAIDDRLAVLDRAVGNARDTLRIVDLRIEEGMTMRGDRGVQAIEVRRPEAQRVQLAQARRTTVSALAVLVGAEAPDFSVPRLTLATLMVPAIAPGQPADLLVRRPDIAAAEARIAATDGDVDQARAAFLPTLRLSASAIAQSATIGGPIGTTLAATQGLVAPIFAGGRLRGRLDATNAQRTELVAAYRQALLTALGEGVNALAAQDGARERGRLFADVLAQARDTGAIVRERYAAGETDLAGLLDADRNVLTAEDGAVLAAQDRLVAAIDLFRALGGGPRSPVTAHATATPAASLSKETTAW